MARAPGGVIVAVDANSLGDAIGLEAGDRLVSINDRQLRDIIDVQFYSADESLDLEVERAGQRVHIQVERDYDDQLGLTFANPTFDVGGFDLAVDFESNISADDDVITAEAAVDLPWFCGRDPALTATLHRD